MNSKKYRLLKDLPGRHAGDIVAFLGYKPRIITWSPKGRSAGWYVSRVDLQQSLNDHFPLYAGGDLEVIGNIYKSISRK